MRLTQLIATVSVLMLGNTANAADRYKCLEDDGSLSQQEVPCALPAWHGKTPEGFDGIVLPVPGVGHVAVPVFADLNFKVHQHNGQAITVALWAKSGQPPMEMLWTFFANRSSGPYSAQEARARLTSLSPALSHPSLPAEAEKWKFQIGVGEAQMITQYAPNQTFAGDEWDSATLGLAITPTLVAAATILNAGDASKSLTAALSVLNETHLVATEDLQSP